MFELHPFASRVGRQLAGARALEPPMVHHRHAAITYGQRLRAHVGGDPILAALDETQTVLANRRFGRIGFVRRDRHVGFSVRTARRLPGNLFRLAHVPERRRRGLVGFKGTVQHDVLAWLNCGATCAGAGYYDRIRGNASNIHFLSFLACVPAPRLIFSMSAGEMFTSTAVPRISTFRQMDVWSPSYLTYPSIPWNAPCFTRT